MKLIKSTLYVIMLLGLILASIMLGKYIAFKQVEAATVIQYSPTKSDMKEQVIENGLVKIKYKWVKSDYYEIEIVDKQSPSYIFTDDTIQEGVKTTKLFNIVQ